MRMQAQADARSLEDLAGIIERHLRSLRRDLAAHRQPAPWSWTDPDGTVITVQSCEDDDLNPGSIHIAVDGTAVCITPHAQPALIAALQRA